MIQFFRIREETEVPENQLQKTRVEPHDQSPRESRISEYEMRFRKSTEKLTVPDWYRENRPQGQTAQTSTYRYGNGVEPMSTTTTTTTVINGTSSHQQAPPPVPPQPIGNIGLPRGMFDRYKDDIEELRRSRSSLHQTGQQETSNRQVVAL